MAKWAVGEVSGAPEFPVGIDQIGMAGVRTIKVDGLRGLVRLLELTLAISPARDRRSLSAGPSADNRNPIGFEGWNGPRTCLGMGRTGGAALGRSSGDCLVEILPNNHLWSNALGRAKSKVRGE